MNRSITFGHFVDKYWIPFLEAERSLITYQSYRNIIRRHGQPLEPLQLRSITTQDVLDLMAPIRRSGLSPHSRHAIECAFSSVFGLAITKGVIDRSPMADMRRTANQCLPFTPYTDEQLTRIERCLPYYPYGNVFGAVMHSGLRRNEILGITAEDFPQEIQRNRVRITYVVLENGTFDRPTQNRREEPQEIVVSDKTRRYLEGEHRRLCERARHTGYRNENHLLFSDPTGGPVSLHKLGEASHAVRDMSCVPSFSLNNLRRTYRQRCNSSQVL